MKTFDYSLVKDQQYIKEGRMDAHTDHTYYRDVEETQEKETAFRYDLNRNWKFHYARNYGRGGIRTLDTEFPYAAFPGRYIQPLSHPSKMERAAGFVRARNCTVYF